MSPWLPESEWLKMQPGDVIEQLQLHGSEEQPSRFEEGQTTIVIKVSTDERPKAKYFSPNVGCLRALDKARVPQHATIRIERFEDTNENGRTLSVWDVRLLDTTTFANGGGAPGPSDDIPFAPSVL